MHVLMTVNTAWNIWNFRRPVVRQLLLSGHQVTVLAPFDGSVPELEAAGCRFVHLDMNAKGLNPVEDFRLYKRMERHFRTSAPDIVLSYTIKNNVFGALAAKAAGIPFIPNVTGLGTAFLSGGALERVAEVLYRRAFQGLETVFFQNEDDRDLFLDRRLVSVDQARLLPGSGIDLSYFAPADFPCGSAPPIFLMISRLLRDKGVFEFVEAARLVKSVNPKPRFQLLGSIGAENRTAIPESQVKSWVDRGWVEYLGTVPDVRPVVESSSCVVLPSYREGAPRTLIEAAAMARPVITTDVPGCRAVVDRDVSGYLCDLRSAQSLASAINRFLDLPREQKVAMGRAGRSKMEREFSESIVVSRYLEAIASASSAKDISGEGGASSSEL